MTPSILITVLISIHGSCVNGILKKTEFWVAETRAGNRERGFEICHSNGGRLLDLETPQARILLKKLQHLNPSDYEVRYYIGLRLFGNDFIWDEGCRPADPETLSFVTGDLTDYASVDFRPICFQLQYSPGFKGYLGLNFKGRWTKCEHERRMICEIPTTGKCRATLHDHVIMARNLSERVLPMDKEDIRLCSDQCDVQTVDEKNCWFYGMKDKMCHLWFARYQPFASPLQKQRVDGFTIYAKDCLDVIIGDLPSTVAATVQDYQSCRSKPIKDTVTVVTTRIFENQPTTAITKTIDMTFIPSTHEEVEAVATTPGGVSDKSFSEERTEPSVMTNTEARRTIITPVTHPSDEEVTTTGAVIIRPSIPKSNGCLCTCVKKINQTAQEKEEFTSEIVANLTIDVTNTSANVRKYVSAKDDRPSAKKIGGVGAVMLVIAFGTPVLLDLSKVVIFLIQLTYNYQRKEKPVGLRIKVKSCHLEPETTDETVRL